MKRISLATTIALTLAATGVSAANYSVDGRGDAMGGVGVVSADFLTAPFYNPALAALYRRKDNSGMLLPSLGLSYNDQGDLFNTITSIPDIVSSGDVAAATEVLNKLDGGDLTFDFGGAVAFAIPNSYLSMNVYAKAYTESFVSPIKGTNGGDDSVNLGRTEISLFSVGVTEIGMTFAKYYTLLGQHTSFGITPKIQRVYTLMDIMKPDDFGFSSLTDSETGETAFNMDAGAVWFYGPYRIGFSAMNLFARDIETNTAVSNASGTSTNISYVYQLQPNYTVGIGLVGDYYSFSVDYDLIKREKFKGVDDDAQMLRAGLELDLMRQVQFRAGYYTNLAKENSDGTLTAGVGLSPLGIITMDIGASYTNSKSMGVYVNFLGSY